MEEFYVIQETVEEGTIPLYGNRPTPKTVLIPSMDVLRTHSKSQILDDSKKYGLEVLPSMVKTWGLQEGDFVHADRQDGTILSVNRERDPNVIRQLPEISGPEAIEAKYPERHLPVEKFGDVGLRAATLLSPIGLGQSLYVAGPGGSGKTTMLLNLVESVSKLTNEIPNLVLICVQVGERAEDSTDYKKAIDKTKRAIHRVEMYSSPREDRLLCQLQVLEFAVYRARRLVSFGFHVVLVIDSVTRALMAHSRSYEGNAGMIAGGIYTTSISYIARLLAVAGYFDENRSLTVVSSVLTAAAGKKTSEGAYYEETVDSATTAKWVLTGIPMAPYPRLSMSESWTRRPERFCTPKQLREMEDVKKMMWGSGVKAEDAHKYLVEYATEHPIPDYFSIK